MSPSYNCVCVGVCGGVWVWVCGCGCGCGGGERPYKDQISKQSDNVPYQYPSLHFLTAPSYALLNYYWEGMLYRDHIFTPSAWASFLAPGIQMVALKLIKPADSTN